MQFLEEEFKVTRAGEEMMHKGSSNPKMAQVGMEVRTQRKWRAVKAVLQVESHCIES